MQAALIASLLSWAVMEIWRRSTDAGLTGRGLPIMARRPLPHRRVDRTPFAQAPRNGFRQLTAISSVTWPACPAAYSDQATLPWQKSGTVGCCIEELWENKMAYGDREENRSVALYWDFENLHAGLAEAKFGEGYYAKSDTRFKPQEPLVDVQAVTELSASFGPIAINRAYCNWQFYGRYRDALLQSAVELIQLFPPGASAKNGADIKLCLDATEDISRFGHIGTIIIVGGDSDFMPVAQKIKAAGKILIGVGTRKNTNRHWAKSCHEFRYYENLVEEEVAESVAKPNEGLAVPPQPPADPAAEILKRAIRLLAETKGEPWVNKGSVWHMVKRLDSTFDPKDHGHANFAEMVKALDTLVEVRKGDSDHIVRLR